MAWPRSRANLEARFAAGWSVLNGHETYTCLAEVPPELILEDVVEELVAPPVLQLELVEAVEELPEEEVVEEVVEEPKVKGKPSKE